MVAREKRFEAKATAIGPSGRLEPRVPRCHRRAAPGHDRAEARARADRRAARRGRCPRRRLRFDGSGAAATRRTTLTRVPPTPRTGGLRLNTSVRDRFRGSRDEIRPGSRPTCPCQRRHDVLEIGCGAASFEPVREHGIGPAGSTDHEMSRSARRRARSGRRRCPRLPAIAARPVAGWPVAAQVAASRARLLLEPSKRRS